MCNITFSIIIMYSITIYSTQHTTNATDNTTVCLYLMDLYLIPFIFLF